MLEYHAVLCVEAVVLGRDVMTGGASLDQSRGRERMRSARTACWHA